MLKFTVAWKYVVGKNPVISMRFEVFWLLKNFPMLILRFGFKFGELWHKSLHPLHFNIIKWSIKIRLFGKQLFRVCLFFSQLNSFRFLSSRWLFYLYHSQSHFSLPVKLLINDYSDNFCQFSYQSKSRKHFDWFGSR